MKQFHFHEINYDCSSIYLCKYEEFNVADFLQFLTESEIQHLMSFTNSTRKREFIATRILRHRIFGFSHIHYNSVGAPFIQDQGFISISHSNKYVGIALNQNFQIGFDIEIPRSNILSLSEKFLSEEEKSTFDIKDPLEVTKIWSAKEALYKLAGRKKIHFKSELLLNRDPFNNWKGKIINDDHVLHVKLHNFEFEGIILTINKEEIVKEYKHI